METVIILFFLALLRTGRCAAAGPAERRGRAAGVAIDALEPPPPDPEGYGTRWIYMPDGDGVPRVAFLQPEGDGAWGPPGRAAADEEVVFSLFTRNNPKDGQRIFANSSDSLKGSRFDSSKPTRFLVHGWMSSMQSTTVTNLRDAYLEAGDYNVVAVDWSGWAASSFYWWSKTSVPEVGRLLGQLAVLMAKQGADARDMHLVGHSLGAHVVGSAGSHLTQHARGARVTGLDPALPGFQYYEYAEGRLDESDGEFVQVIHTCSGALGYTSPIGHVDFYPNNGTPMQPGCCCVTEVIQACSHARAHEYFAESITSDVGFYAVNCQTWEEYTNKKCSSNSAVLMGEKTPRTARGTYFLATNSTSPYALGLESWMEPLHL